MKLILSITAILVCTFFIFPFGSSRASVPAWTLTGTMRKVEETAVLQAFLVDVNINRRHVSGQFDLADAKGQTLNSWKSNPTEVVKLGRMNLSRIAVLTPSPIYGITSTCYAKGYLFHDDVDDTYTTKQLSIVYTDPVSKQKKVDEIQGTVEPRAKDGSTTLYDLKLSWKDGDLFGPQLTGTITKDAGSISYSLTVRNMNEQQFENFTNWWLHCVVPSL